MKSMKERTKKGCVDMLWCQLWRRENFGHIPKRFLGPNWSQCLVEGGDTFINKCQTYKDRHILTHKTDTIRQAWNTHTHAHNYRKTHSNRLLIFLAADDPILPSFWNKFQEVI